MTQTGSRTLRDQKIVWSAMKGIYKLLATPEAQKIIEILLDSKEMRSKELMNSADLTESQFHPIMKQLVKYAIIEKTVKQEDRGVMYNLSLFGKNVLDLSKPLLKEIRESLSEQQIIAN